MSEFPCINPCKHSPFTWKEKSQIIQWFTVLPIAAPKPTEGRTGELE